MVGAETGDVAIPSVAGVMALLQDPAVILDVDHRVACVTILHGTCEDAYARPLGTEFHGKEAVTWVLLEVLTAVEEDLTAMHGCVRS